jgi:regulator of protease activity HflC (stomatin/prohibitin superfamily)
MAEVTNLAEVRQQAQARQAWEDQGWRAGRPLEDPEKTKRWGFVSAKPSEYLVHVRRGKVRARSSGQGMTCFKWPWDAVAIIPTSLQRMQFVADQVTLEKVGVNVVGLAVYRIADPLLAFRVLNFAYPERAQQKLEETLNSMFVGAIRRLIANLSVDDCLRKRKSALAVELLREIAPVVGGQGRPDDTTTQGWGVVIDTIEIQEVRVSSESVFAAMQAPFRAAVEREAREARAEADKEIATREAACNQSIEEARIAAELEVRDKRAELERAEAEAARNRSLREAAIEREVEEAKIDAATVLEQKRSEADQQRAAAQVEAEIRRQELAAGRAEAELAAHRVQQEAMAQRAELERIEWTAELARRRADTEVAAIEGRDQAEIQLAHARAARERAEAEAQVLMAKNLPELAAAVGQRFGEVNVTQIGGVENAFGSIAQAVGAVLELAKRGGRPE